jgi:UDP-N-acetylmuramate--alanine ligase
MGIPGVFNALNAVAALASAHIMGVDAAEACGIIGGFKGVHRRFERTGTLNGAEIFHDYGHNPAEMRNALSIARKRCRNGRLWAVMQPHTYSRVKTLFEELLTCTEEADITLVTDICGAREKDPGDINSGMLVEGMKKHGINAVWTPSFQETANAIKKGVQPGDLVITMGCGDIDRLNDLLNLLDIL